MGREQGRKVRLTVVEEEKEEVVVEAAAKVKEDSREGKERKDYAHQTRFERFRNPSVRPREDSRRSRKEGGTIAPAIVEGADARALYTVLGAKNRRMCDRKEVFVHSTPKITSKA